MPVISQPNGLRLGPGVGEKVCDAIAIPSVDPADAADHPGSETIRDTLAAVGPVVELFTRRGGPLSG
jgi:hypothetical protein